MIDTVKIYLHPNDVHYDWNIENIKSKLQPAQRIWRNGYRPIGLLKNMAISGNNSLLIIDGSLAKYYNGNNVQNFDWRHIKPAIDNLSEELELPIADGRLSRVDIGYCLQVSNPVVEYFPELTYLEYYQRITRHKTSLRFEGNSIPQNVLVYDKLLEARKKQLIDEISLRHLTSAEHLMRIEYQLQGRLSRVLKQQEVRVKDLYTEDFCKQLIKLWFDNYMRIHKEAIVKYPQQLKGSKNFEKFLKRLFVQMFGWEKLNYLMKQGIIQDCWSASDKSKKLKQFREAMLDNSSFDFQEHTLELNEHVKRIYVKALTQIFKLD